MTERLEAAVAEWRKLKNREDGLVRMLEGIEEPDEEQDSDGPDRVSVIVMRGASGAQVDRIPLVELLLQQLEECRGELAQLEQKLSAADAILRGSTR